VRRWCVVDDQQTRHQPPFWLEARKSTISRSFALPSTASSTSGVPGGDM
jgi:hypothetical protein